MQLYKMSHYVIFARFYFGNMWLVCITYSDGPTYKCTMMVEILPFFPADTHFGANYGHESSDD